MTVNTALPEDDQIPVTNIVEKLISEEAPQDVRVAEKAAAVVDVTMIQSAADEAVELFKDGFQVSDIFPAINKLMEIAEVVEGASGAEKKELVVQAAKLAYQKLNPDISKWIPQVIENKLVNWALDSLLPSVVDWAVGLTKGEAKINEPS